MARFTTRWLACWLLVGLLAGGTMIAARAARNQDSSNSSQASTVSAISAQVPPASPTVQPAAPAAPPAPKAPTAPAHGTPPSRPAPTPGSPASGAPPLGLPPIEFHPAKVDLGVVRPGVKTSFTEYIQNVGVKTVKIVQARPSCVCTTITLTKTAIAPGENIPLDIVYSSTTGLGHKKAAVRILFEGYDVVELQIEAFVALSVHAEPAYINALEDENGKQDLIGEYTVLSSDNRSFRILGVNGSTPPYVDFDPAKDSPRTTYKLKWDLTGYAADTCRNPQGDRMPGWLAIETDHPDCPIFDIEIRHRCVRRSIVGTETWTSQEKRVLVGAIKPGESGEIELTAKFLPKHGHDDVIKAVMSESTEFTAELIDVKSTADSMICHIRIKPAPDHKGLVYGTMRISSEHQSDPVTVIAVVR